MLNALRFLELDVRPTRTEEDFARATHLVLPGVGAFGAAMRRLNELELVEPLRRAAVDGTPVLGICVGMQVLASVGREFDEVAGLELVPGAVERIPAAEHGLRLPHMGWNEAAERRPSPLLEGLGRPPAFYFAHSYRFVPDDPAVVIASCDYGVDVVAVLSAGNVHGVQFHPEKSQRDGLRLLQNFAALPGGAEPAGTASRASS